MSYVVNDSSISESSPQVVLQPSPGLMFTGTNLDLCHKLHVCISRYLVSGSCRDAFLELLAALGRSQARCVVGGGKLS